MQSLKPRQIQSTISNSLIDDWDQKYGLCCFYQVETWLIKFSYSFTSLVYERLSKCYNFLMTYSSNDSIWLLYVYNAQICKYYIKCKGVSHLCTTNVLNTYVCIVHKINKYRNLSLCNSICYNFFAYLPINLYLTETKLDLRYFDWPSWPWQCALRVGSSMIDK